MNWLLCGLSIVILPIVVVVLASTADRVIPDTVAVITTLLPVAAGVRRVLVLAAAGGLLGTSNTAGVRGAVVSTCIAGERDTAYPRVFGPSRGPESWQCKDASAVSGAIPQF